MKLNQHKKLVREYEQMLSELEDLKALPSSTKWEAHPNTNVGFAIPLSPDYMRGIVRARIVEIGSHAKEMARTLGIDYEEPV